MGLHGELVVEEEPESEIPDLVSLAFPDPIVLLGAANGSGRGIQGTPGE